MNYTWMGNGYAWDFFLVGAGCLPACLPLALLLWLQPSACLLLACCCGSDC
jgi:hypothetical protein